MCVFVCVCVHVYMCGGGEGGVLAFVFACSCELVAVWLCDGFCAFTCVNVCLDCVSCLSACVTVWCAFTCVNVCLDCVS